MRVICNKKDECMNPGCQHFISHDRFYGCDEKTCNEVRGKGKFEPVECIQADPIRFELVEG